MSGRYVFLTDRSTVGTIRGMATWDDLSITVARLAGQDPRPLTQWPEPDSRPDQGPPFRIGLAAWAATVADVVDPRTGAVTGGYSGFVFTMLRSFTVPAGQTTRVPLLVATDSFLPDLGYAIPAGDWGVQATLDPALGQAVRTPILPITIEP